MKAVRSRLRAVAGQHDVEPGRSSAVLLESPRALITAPLAGRGLGHVDEAPFSSDGCGSLRSAADAAAAVEAHRCSSSGSWCWGRCRPSSANMSRSGGCPGRDSNPYDLAVRGVQAWRARVVLSALDRLVPPDLALRSVRSSLVHEVVAGGLTSCAPSVHSVDVFCRTGCTTIW
jgi:hypothetical protein